MEKIVGVVSKIPASKNKNDDDFVDRLSSRYTVVILVVFALVVTLQTYVGKPITCWAPKHFTGSHTKYTNSYCWVRNTYYVPMSEPHLPAPGQPREHVIPYYQWVPFILLAQAVLFYMPSIFWHAFNQKGGVDCDNILEAAHTLTMTSKAQGRERKLRLITNQMHRFLASRMKKFVDGCHCDVQHIMKMIFKPCGTRLGNYLVLLFIVSKILYMGNLIAQIFLLNIVLGTEFNAYGFEVIDYLRYGKDWTDSPNVAFPRVTFCDLDVRRLGNTQRYTVQCTLPINMFTEKIYMFLWFWMVIVAVATGLGLVVWLLRACMAGDRMKFVTNHLDIAGKVDKSGDAEDVRNFVNDYLCQDGVFVLRLIAHNTNNITVTEITCSLWDRYQEFKKSRNLESFEPTTTSEQASSLISDPKKSW